MQFHSTYRYLRKELTSSIGPVGGGPKAGFNPPCPQDSGKGGLTSEPGRSRARMSVGTAPYRTVHYQNQR